MFSEKIKRSILFFLIILLSFNSSKAFAVEKKKINPNFHFDFVPNTYEISSKNELKVKIIHKSENPKMKNWKVRPQAENAEISVYNNSLQEWVFTNNSWNKMPNFQTKLKMKIYTNEKNVNLKLLMKDTEENKIYQTPSKKIWTNQAYDSYYKKLNKNIKEWRFEGDFDSQDNNEFEVQTQKVGNLKKFSKIAYINLGAFFIAGIVGFTRKNDKIPS